MKEIILVLVGGICSAMGGVIAILYQAKITRKIRMEEVRGEQQLEACKKALSLVHKAYRLYNRKDDFLDFLDKHDEWFSMNQILLPHTFVENWESMRLSLKPIDNTNNGICKEIAKINTKCKEHTRGLIEEADEVLRKELKLPKVNIKTPGKENG
jgi:hypothetical protein